MGLCGKQLSNGCFEVEDICFPEMPEQEETVAMDMEEQDKYVSVWATGVIVAAVVGALCCIANNGTTLISLPVPIFRYVKCVLFL